MYIRSRHDFLLVIFDDSFSLKVTFRFLATETKEEIMTIKHSRKTTMSSMLLIPLRIRHRSLNTSDS